MAGPGRAGRARASGVDVAGRADGVGVAGCADDAGGAGCPAVDVAPAGKGAPRPRVGRRVAADRVREEPGATALGAAPSPAGSTAARVAGLGRGEPSPPVGAPDRGGIGARVSAGRAPPSGDRSSRARGAAAPEPVAGRSDTDGAR